MLILLECRSSADVYSTTVPSQKAASAYFSSKLLLSFGFAGRAPTLWDIRPAGPGRHWIRSQRHRFLLVISGGFSPQPDRPVMDIFPSQTHVGDK